MCKSQNLIRPPLDYSGIIYDQTSNYSFHQKLESIQYNLRACSLVVSDLRSETRNQRLPVRVRLLVICRGEPSAVIAWLISKCLWSVWKWWRGVIEITFLYPCCPVNRECLWKKTQTNKKNPYLAITSHNRYAKRQALRIIAFWISSLAPLV